jgi:antibiotic biosynthesis monooxygenase (ABM) superfamily enzyme
MSAYDPIADMGWLTSATFSAIFPLTIAVPWALKPVFTQLPLLGELIVRHVIVAAVVVGLMTYMIMPHYTRLAASWLYR